MTERKELTTYGLAALLEKHDGNLKGVTLLEWHLNNVETEMNRVSEQLEYKLNQLISNCQQALSQLKEEGAMASLWESSAAADVTSLQVEMATLRKLYANLTARVQAEAKAEGGETK